MNQFVQDKLTEIKLRRNATQPFKFESFWGSHNEGEIGLLSQWHPCVIELSRESMPSLGKYWFSPEDRITVPSAEHAMMFCKAMIFKDIATMMKIVAAPHPKDAKRLGREVKNYDDGIWSKLRYGVVYDVNVIKFSKGDCAEAFTYLRQFTDNDNIVFVETSPYDGIWGIGLRGKAPEDPSDWKGSNLLGFVLTDVYDKQRGMIK